MKEQIITPELKRKITERWNIITDHQLFNPMPQGGKSTALAQLEYILIEAGLLAARRSRPSEKAMNAAQMELDAAKAIGQLKES